MDNLIICHLLVFGIGMRIWWFTDFVEISLGYCGIPVFTNVKVFMKMLFFIVMMQNVFFS